MPLPSTMTPIATTTLGSAQSSVTFSSISGSYTDLVLVASIKGDNASMSLGIRVNNDSATNYSVTWLEGDGSTASSSRLTSATRIGLSNSVSYNSTNFGTQVVHFMNYSNTTTNKTILQRFNSASGGSFPGVSTSVGLWRSTSAINQVDVITTVGGTNFASGSTFTLYGIKAA